MTISSIILGSSKLLRGSSLGRMYSTKNSYQNITEPSVTTMKGYNDE